MAGALDTYDPEMLRQLIDVVPGLVSFIDKDLNYGFLSERYRDWFGIDPSMFIESNVRDLVGEDGFRVLEPHLRRGLIEHHIFEIDVPFARGGRRFMRGYLVPVRGEDGEVSGMFSLSIDITEDKDEEFKLTKARDDAMATATAKSRFLAAASHDLRQPLHSLTLFASALSRRVDEGEASDLVRNMQVTLQSLNQMFNALLDVTKLDAGLVGTNVEEFPINRIFEQILYGFEAQAQARNLKFRLVPSAIMVQSDPVLLETMVRNLASNALKFTNSGSVLVGIRRHGKRASIEIWDTGPGIPDDRLNLIFEEFERYSRTANTVDEGLGLGLAIVRRLAKLLDHEVTVASVVGSGSVFRIDVPISTTAEIVEVSVNDPFDFVEMQDCKILILDDDPLIVSALTSELQDNGALVSGAHSIFEAMERIRLQGKPDLVIADLYLENELTGIGFINQLNSHFGFTPPALIISGSTDAESLAILEASGHTWLTKPVDPLDLHRAIAMALTR